MLKQTNEPGPNLRQKLASRLEQAMEGLHTPTTSNDPPLDQNLDQNFGYPWSLFDEASLQSAAYQFWPLDQPLEQGL